MALALLWRPIARPLSVTRWRRAMALAAAWRLVPLLALAVALGLGVGLTLAFALAAAPLALTASLPLSFGLILILVLALILSLVVTAILVGLIVIRRRRGSVPMAATGARRGRAVVGVIVRGLLIILGAALPACLAALMPIAGAGAVVIGRGRRTVGVVLRRGWAMPARRWRAAGIVGIGRALLLAVTGDRQTHCGNQA